MAASKSARPPKKLRSRADRRSCPSVACESAVCVPISVTGRLLSSSRTTCCTVAASAAGSPTVRNMKYILPIPSPTCCHGLQSAGKSRRRHANDGEGLLIEFERLADDCRVGAEPFLPELMAEYDHRRSACPVILSGGYYTGIGVQPVLGRQSRCNSRRT